MTAPGAFIHTWARDDAVGDGVDEFSFESDTEFTVPSSVETIGDRCFENCSRMRTITFEDASGLRKIAKRALAGSRLTSITIPASTQEIDGFTFVGCRLETI
jgi:hypothetical protein